MGAAGKVHAIQANVGAAFPSASKSGGRMDSWAGMDVETGAVVKCECGLRCWLPRIPCSECERPSLQRKCGAGDS